MVRSPLTWTLTYAGYAPTRLPELLKAKLRPAKSSHSSCSATC